MTIPTGVVEALTAALTDGADASTALRLALAGYMLVPVGTLPVAYTDAEELRALKKARYGDMFVPKTFDEADPQAIPLYLEPQHNPDLVTFPRITFKPAEDERWRIIMRGDEQVGTMYHWNDGGKYFLDIPGHHTADMPGFNSEAMARESARSILDKPA